MGYNTKNYNTQGGEKTVINGELAITTLGKLTINEKQLMPASLQLDSTALDIADLVADFNALLLKLKTAGLMESE